MSTTAPDHPSRGYCLISPCRDEARYMQRTLDSVAGQSVPPALWLIVDDGSTDQTPRILAEFADRFDFIRVLERADRGRRSVGPGVVEAFYVGYGQIDPSAYDYVCKLDLDLELPPSYFETLMQRMESNRRIGTCSGKPYVVDSNGAPRPETCGDEMSVGMIKFYRTTCFEQIGGFVRQVMWDGIDCHRCRQLGWIACSWDDAPLRFTHLRAMGSSEGGTWTGRKRHGFGQYFMGTGLMYMTASALFRMSRPPYIAGGVAMWWGYVSSMLKRRDRYSDTEFRRFLRRYQWDCLLRGKPRATRRLDQVQAAHWDPVAHRRGAMLPA